MAVDLVTLKICALNELDLCVVSYHALSALAFINGILIPTKQCRNVKVKHFSIFLMSI